MKCIWDFVKTGFSPMSENLPVPAPQQHGANDKANAQQQRRNAENDPGNVRSGHQNGGRSVSASDDPQRGSGGDKAGQQRPDGSPKANDGSQNQYENPGKNGGAGATFMRLGKRGLPGGIGLPGGGVFCLLRRAAQLRHGTAEDPAQRQKIGRAGQGSTPLPFGNCLPGYIELFGKCFLGEPLLRPETADPCTEGLGLRERASISALRVGVMVVHVCIPPFPGRGQTGTVSAFSVAEPCRTDKKPAVNYWLRSRNFALAGAVSQTPRAFLLNSQPQ